jgi:NAD(P)H-nitrite reductase large subunit
MERYVIVGQSAAGLSAAEAIRTVDGGGDITLVSDEPGPGYSRVLLSHYLEGEIGEDELYWRGRDLAERLGARTRLGVKAVGLDPEGRRLTLADGEELTYTKLLLATGARPQGVEAPGCGLQGIYTLRTLAEARAIRAAAERAGRALVVGGGLVALKAACALQRLGVQVTLAVSSAHLLSRNLDREGAALVQRHLEEHGLRVLLNEAVEGFEGDSAGRVRAAGLTGGRLVPCELVVTGKGVLPNVELARAAGLLVRRGIVVGPTMEASPPGIYAAGDVAEGFDPVREEYAVNAIWPSAVAQGKAAGRNMAGLVRRFPGMPGMNSVVFAGLPLITAGAVREEGPGCEVFTQSSPAERIYKKLVVRDGRVVGLCLIGDVAGAGLIIGLMKAGTSVERIKGRLLDDGLVYPRLGVAGGL